MIPLAGSDLWDLLLDDEETDMDEPIASNWDEWREALAKALQGQYGGAKMWPRLDEIARDGWRNDAAEIMASLPLAPQDPIGAPR